MSSSPLSVLVVDDNKTAAEAVAALLRRDGHQVEVRYDGRAGIEAMGALSFDLVLTDLRMEPIDGLAVVRAARSHQPPIDVMVFTAFGSVDVAVEAMRLGALDFLTKPVTADQILNRVAGLRPAANGDFPLIGDSDATVGLREQASTMARVRSTVLITGEPGSGRRHLARHLHAHGLDHGRPLIVARPGQVIDEDRLAQAGTLLLSDVDSWSQDAQVTLLRMLEGLEAGQPPRVVASATPGIDMAAAQGEMAPELYFRLAVLVVRIPPLRERPADLAPLLRHFLSAHAAAFGKGAPMATPTQLAQLKSHAWPGNVREVANLAERAVVLGGHAFDMEIRPAQGADRPLPTLAEGFNLPGHLEEIERTLLVRAIEQTGGDRPAMCRLLGLERNTLRYKLNKYALLDRT
ncbi:MAG: sigma-54-dependent Fis family transcriptional regulator [Alphaproteobacteria bacterium]|nr:sigma-54-dependent Fis family transcriptional regulator [Alphaproteobacteria bacterium]